MEGLWKMMEQGGFAGVAALALIVLGALAKYHVQREKEHAVERQRSDAEHEAEHKEFETCLKSYADKLLEGLSLQVRANEQNTAAIQSFREALNIYQQLQGLTEFVRQRRNPLGGPNDQKGRQNDPDA